MSAMLDFDTGPLNWVRSDIEAALKSAADRIRAYQSDGNLENALRLARNEAHQATGALRMVGLEGAAAVAFSIEETLSAMDNQTVTIEQASETILDALETLHKWVSRMAEGRGEGELALFPAYRKLRELNGAERVFEGELFYPSLQVRPTQSDSSSMPEDELATLVKTARTGFQRGLLAFLRGVQMDAGLAAMRKSLSQIEAVVPSQAARTFWWACVGFIDALQNKGVEPDFHVKQLLARIDLQMRRLMDGSPQVAERLMRDALFFIAKSKSVGSEAQAVRSAFSLEKYLPRHSSLNAEQKLRFRPLLKDLKDNLGELRHHWNSFSEGHAPAMDDFKASVTRFISKADMLGIPTLSLLANTLNEASALMNQLNDDQSRDSVRLEIATTLLFLQNANGNEDLFEQDFPVRAESQARRIKAALAGKVEGGAEDLIDEGTRKANEHALLNQLGREIVSSLHQMEEILDAFFRDATQRESLSSLDGLTNQIQGALAILEQHDASQLLEQAMELMSPHVTQGSPGEEEKTKLADALSSIGLFIEAHCAGRQDAARILIPARVAFGLAEPEASEASFMFSVEDGLAARKATVAATYLDWQSEGGDDTKKKFLAALTELGHDADLIADNGLKSSVQGLIQRTGTGNPDESLATAITQLTGHEIDFVSPITLAETTSPYPDPEKSDQANSPVNDEAADAASLPAQPAIEPFKAETPGTDISTQASSDEHVACSTLPETMAAEVEELPEIDPELLEIFLEEANEVLQTLGSAAGSCLAKADDHESLTVIRRAFHTLKGSSRMVGLTAFGEAGWGMEQLLNGWIADEKPANPDLLTVVNHAHDFFADWVVQLQNDSRSIMDARRLLEQAENIARGEPIEAGALAKAGMPEELPARDSVSEIINADENEARDEEIDAEPEAPFQVQDILIAGVRLSPSLYQVFKDESAFWSQILLEEHEKLASDEVTFVSEPARRGVHTLAGIAGTTGFTALSELTHAIEIYLKELDDRPLPANARPILRDALLRAVGMIENIHAGAAPLSYDTLIRALAGLQLEEYLPEDLAAGADQPVRTSEAEQTTTNLTAPQDNEVSIEFVAVEPEFPEEFQGEVVAEEDDETSIEFVSIGPELTEECQDEAVAEEAVSAIQIDETETTAGASENDASLIETVVPQADAIAEVAETRLEDLVAEARRQASTPVFEQRQVKDEIDADLLPIFLEEAETLIPQAAENLRRWKAKTDNSEFPSELRRTLHTIKGSARMAGAMRLGELTHIMESRVIEVLEGQLTVDARIFDTLESQYDRMANDVDRLRSGMALPEVSQTETAASEVGVVLPPEETSAPSSETRVITAAPAQSAPAPTAQVENMLLRVRSEWIDRMVNEAGEVAIARSRIESEMFSLKRQVKELSEALRRLKGHVREVEIQAESQMQATFQSHGNTSEFDPLEFDRFTRFQEVTRFLAESLHDISTIQQNLSVQLGEADAALVQQARMNRELQQNLLRVRMVPLNSVSERLYRVVRQAGRDLNKRAQLDIRNGELELDRGILEKVVAPIEHLLRNAVAHGLEMPEARIAAGKTEYGDIRIEARQEGNEMALIIKDDGAGLDLNRIRDKAIAQNLLSPGVEPSDHQLAQMIFVPGFSTAEQVTEISGRGVGMDVVKNEINSLGGRIEIATETGKGVTFSIYLPLTLAMTQAVIVNANKQEYALPATMVEQVQELKPDHLAAAIHAQAIEWRGNRYPLFYLPHLLGQTEAVHEVQRFNTVVLMKSSVSHAALLVDVVEGAREIVVKNIGSQLARMTGIAGATVRGDGKVMLILNPVPLAIRALSAPVEASVPFAPRAEPVQETVQAPMVLVVDDSLTVRKITSRLMAREGYRVDTAKDGVDALEKMQDLIPDVVLLDVEMPRMDGFELARVMRNDEKLRNVPIIMITSRSADKHRNHALEIGVNVYLGKPFQEANLLGHIGELVGGKVAVAD